MPLLSLFSAILTWLLVVGVGSILTDQLKIRIPQYSRIFFIILLGVTGYTTLIFVLSLVLSFPTGFYIGKTAIILGVIGYWWRNPRSIWQPALVSIQSIGKEKPLLLLLVGFGVLLFALFHTHFIPSVASGLSTGESTYGDLPFHLTIISQIAYGHTFPPENPQYSGIKLVYPYFINFFSALLVKDGLSLRYALLIPGMILAWGFLGICYDFALTITKKGWISFLAVTLYCLNGGLGFYYFFADHHFALGEMIEGLKNVSELADYSDAYRQNIQWANFLSRIIVPERSILLGLPLGLIILRILFFRDTPGSMSMKEIILIAVLCSFMPFIHTHTVIVLAVMLPLIIVLKGKEGLAKSSIRQYSLLLGITLLFAIPYTIPLFWGHIAESESFFKLNTWWNKPPEEHPIWYWFKNTYLVLPLACSIFFISKLRQKNLATLLICGFTLLAIMNVALFQPYSWDNIKFLLWAHLFFSLAIASLFYFGWTEYRLFRPIIGVTFLTLVLSAILSIYRELNYKVPLFNQESVSLAQITRNQTKKDALFLTYPIHNSFISSLAGRKIVMGYPGSLWVHGIKYQSREKDIKAIYSGDPSAMSLLDLYKIDYIVIEKDEPNGFTVNRDFYRAFPVFAATSNYTIYQVPK